jgi:SAM-dependent methyltransferase
MEARRRCPSSEFIAADMREVHRINGSFDAIICLWQSFGYFDEATNAKLLKKIHALLVPKGRFVLDIYNRDFFLNRLGVRTFEKQGLTISESKALEGRRLRVKLDYGDDLVADDFEWEVYTQNELRELSSTLGFTEKVFCSQFDPVRAPSASEPRMQLVLEK